MDKEVWETVRR